MINLSLGDKVRFLNHNERHESNPEFYPELDTVGTITEYIPELDIYLVQWPIGSTSSDDLWAVSPIEIEVV